MFLASDPLPFTFLFWFDLKRAGMLVLVEQWCGRAKAYGTLQAILTQEIAMFDHLKTLYRSETYLLSRRQALGALVVLPTALLAALRQGQMGNALLETFLPHCTAGITSCWYLANDGDFATVDQTISSYLSPLEIIVQQSDAYRTVAASLAAQAYALAGLIAMHRGNMRDCEQYRRTSVTYARASGDKSLLLTTQKSLACTLYLLQRIPEALDIFQQIERESTHMPPLLRSNILIYLAATYGKTNHQQEALRCIDKAHALFPATHSGETPLYLDFGRFALLLYEGKTRLELGQHDPSGEHFQLAETIFACVERLSAIPERFRLEILNHQAEAALRLGQLETFAHFMEQGIQGAQTLGSQKRLQEVIALYQEVSQPTHTWHKERCVQELRDLLVL